MLTTTSFDVNIMFNHDDYLPPYNTEWGKKRIIKISLKKMIIITLKKINQKQIFEE